MMGPPAMPAQPTMPPPAQSNEQVDTYSSPEVVDDYDPTFDPLFDPYDPNDLTID